VFANARFSIHIRGVREAFHRGDYGDAEGFIYLFIFGPLP
jgi:hypothetical protein